jgi:hypothetical protein
LKGHALSCMSTARSNISPHCCLWRLHRRAFKNGHKALGIGINPGVTKLVRRALERKDEHCALPHNRALEPFRHFDGLDKAARRAFLARQHVHYLFGTHASFTRSETSQSRSVTFAAIAGVMRMVEWIFTKL